jgi:hypothetical protein
VDSQFNAKLADLELGVPTFESGEEHPFDGLTVDDFLVNWIAPEALRGETFSQASDVYSLSLVFYEILTRLIPYEDLPAIRETARSTIKDMVVPSLALSFDLSVGREGLSTTAHLFALLDLSFLEFDRERMVSFRSPQTHRSWYHPLPSPSLLSSFALMVFSRDGCRAGGNLLLPLPRS